MKAQVVYWNRIYYNTEMEICVECPKEISKEFTTIIENIMQKAAAKYYTKLPIPAEASVGDHWIH